MLFLEVSDIVELVLSCCFEGGYDEGVLSLVLLTEDGIETKFAVRS